MKISTSLVLLVFGTFLGPLLGTQNVSAADAPKAMPAGSAATAPRPGSGGAISQPKVSFLSPTNGAKVKSEFDLKFDVQGMSIAKAGELKPGTGHHHLIVDAGPVPKGQVIGKDATHIHFGDGASSTHLKLTKGPHTLTLQFADGAHASYGEALSQTIKVEVE